MSRDALSTTFSVQVPLGSCPSKTDSGCSGLNDPVKGAAPALTAVAASSSNTVLVKLLPLPPRFCTSVTGDPVGAATETVRSPVKE